MLARTLGKIATKLSTGFAVALHMNTSAFRQLDYGDAEIWLNVSSHQEVKRLRSCAKEPETVEWIRKYLRAGDTFIDIGANVGAYSLVASKNLDGQLCVYAFEPSVQTFASLAKNIIRNNASRSIVPFCIALDSQNGIGNLSLNDAAAGAARHGYCGHTPDRAPHESRLPVVEQSILTARLDDIIALFSLQCPNHIKIDVDGPELRVLEGSVLTLANERLRSILVENDGSSRIDEYLRNFGFCPVGDWQHSKESNRLNTIFVRNSRQ
jgi:FkbM family methyltransferase